MPRYEELLLPTKVIHQLKRLYPNHKSALCAQYTRGFRVAGGQIYENVYMTIVQMGVFAVLPSVGETTDFSIYSAWGVRNDAEVRIHDSGQIKRCLLYTSPSPRDS